eukprot:3792017-Pyramimonas_sp.AAC.1
MPAHSGFAKLVEASLPRSALVLRNPPFGILTNLALIFPCFYPSFPASELPKYSEGSPLCASVRTGNAIVKISHLLQKELRATGSKKATQYLARAGEERNKHLHD